MKRLFKTKKGVAVLAVIAAVAVAGGAYAYFTGSGSGSGSARVATPASLTITQIGAGYDSLIASGGYHQDQCFQCAQITEFGNKIDLAQPGQQRLVSVVVAFDNWSPAFSDVPITLSIIGGPSSTVTPSIAAAQPSGHPTITNVTFPFNNYVPQEFTYGISFNASGHAGGLNVALSSSRNNLAIGSDTAPGTVWVNTTAGPGIAGDFPNCTTPGAGFAQVTTNCGSEAPGNPGAYGTDAQVTAGNADIPAVEFNVVGGVVPGLYPGGPSQPIDFAITNPGSSSLFVSNVAITASSLSTGAVNNSIEACAVGMYPISPASPGVAIGASVPPGTSFYSPSGASISMTDDGNNQDNCKGATVHLAFSAN